MGKPIRFLDTEKRIRTERDKAIAERDELRDAVDWLDEIERVVTAADQLYCDCARFEPHPPNVHKACMKHWDLDASQEEINKAKSAISRIRAILPPKESE
jgi:hypothetical protein